MDSQKRSILKTVSWRVAATVITAGVTFLLTGRAELAVTVGLGDAAVKLVIYYFHERLWTRIRYGVSRPAEYEI